MPVRDKQDLIITSEKEQEQRWKEHFEETLDSPDPRNRAEIPEASIDLEINTDEPSKLEIVTAIKSSKNNKLPGNDNYYSKLTIILAADTVSFILFSARYGSMTSYQQHDLKVASSNYQRKETSQTVTTGELSCKIRSETALLFIIAVYWVMRSFLSDENTGIRWTFFSKPEELDYADDLAILSHLETQMQRKPSNLQINASKIGLNTNRKKTEEMSLNTKSPPKIQLNGKDVKNTAYFTYLGSVVTSGGGDDKDIISRLGKARGSFIKLKNIWKSSSISRHTKIKLYKSWVLPVLISGAECWRMRESDTKSYQVFITDASERSLGYFANKNLYETTNK
ncbi:uncharacterized protein LOC134276790 [Saccostrea cucullata]|uniref:uncharacterized protein LOC134276790 n=1 Tax=Saccostrea cuccullata TaxID=36930 RepID=UPI002ECFB3E1